MENTFYRVFVGGETVPGCAETVRTYADRGVGFDFPALGTLRLTGKLTFLSFIGRSDAQLQRRTSSRVREDTDRHR